MPDDTTDNKDLRGPDVNRDGSINKPSAPTREDNRSSQTWRMIRNSKFDLETIGIRVKGFVNRIIGAFGFFLMLMTIVHYFEAVIISNGISLNWIPQSLFEIYYGIPVSPLVTFFLGMIVASWSASGRGM